MASDIAEELSVSTKNPGSGHGVNAPSATARHLGVDAFRYCLIFLVVLLHSSPGKPTEIGALDWPVWVQIACRSAVPFFFIASGYFLSPERHSTAALICRPLQRLLPVYIFWMIVYYIFLKIDPITPWLASLQDLVSGGAAIHLWFLPALGFGLALVGAGVRVVGIWITGLICVGLAAFGLANGSYHDVLGFGGDARRGGLIIAPAFVLIGVCLARMNLSPRPVTLAIVVIVANALLFLEEYLILHASGRLQLFSHDFLFSTFLAGTSVFLLAKSIVGGPLVTRLASFGRISLGVYAAHFHLLWPLSQLIGKATLWQVSLLASLTFLLTTLVIMLLRRVPFLYRLIE